MNRRLFIGMSVLTLVASFQRPLHSDCYDGTYQKYCSEFAYNSCTVTPTGAHGELCGAKFVPNLTNSVTRCTQNGGSGLDGCHQYPYLTTKVCGLVQACFVVENPLNQSKTCVVDVANTEGINFEANTPDGYVPYGNSCYPGYYGFNGDTSSRLVAFSAH